MLSFFSIPGDAFLDHCGANYMSFSIFLFSYNYYVSLSPVTSG